jgi:hypothetical protein
MTEKKYAEPLLKVGDYVKIRHSSIKRGRIVELRGPLAPGGVQVYRVLLRRKPRRVYAELREDQVELIPPKEGGSQTTEDVLEEQSRGEGSGEQG